MNYISILLSGIAGTIAMTIFSVFIHTMTKRTVYIPERLSKLLTGKFTNRMIGYTGHFATGLVFAFAYHLLWYWGIGTISVGNAVIFGMGNGLAGVIVWLTGFKIKGEALDEPRRAFLVQVFFAHLPFAIAAFWVAHILLNQDSFNG